MKNNSKISYHPVMEKKRAVIIDDLSKKVKQIVDHKTLEKIISLSEEEQGID